TTMTSNTAVQIVEKVGGLYVLNSEALNEILKHEVIGNKKVAILTVAGAFRKGKSFFLSNIVRYLQGKKNGEDWMAPTAPVSGFTWRQSSQAVTEGILMWPEPFVVKNEKDEEVAILLMDTEGAFDHKSSMTQCATVFALSALLSSVLVYNVSQDVQEDTLNHLQFFAKYGSFALDNAEGSPFQSLFFLIRDWQNGDEFGLEAGRKHLDEVMMAQASADAAMQNLRRDIQRSFVDIKCALLPYPGNKICRGSEGTITVNDMDPDFQVQLGKLVPHLIDNLLRPKEIGGKQITGSEFVEFFKAYSKIFSSGVVPEPKSIFEATSEATHQSALKTSLDHYENAMKAKFCELKEREYFEDANLRSIHEEMLNESVRLFNETKKMGSIPKYLDLLKDDAKAKFEDVYLKDNQNIMTIELTRREKEEAERLRIEQEQRAKEEMERQEREKEALRVQMEKEKAEREEAERQRLEAERAHQAAMAEAEKQRIEAERIANEERARLEAERQRQAEEENQRHQALQRQMDEMRVKQAAEAEETRRREEEYRRMIHQANRRRRNE
ncbi:hypothetical protein PMAYCL1PPCAC_25633, partial [Pristionchus mayeri]